MEIEKLDNYNYATWKDDVLALLMDKRAYKHVMNKNYKLKKETTLKKLMTLKLKRIKLIVQYI